MASCRRDYGRSLPASIEEDQPGRYWREWEEELSRYRQYEGGEEQCCDSGLSEWPRGGYQTQGKDAQDHDQKVLPIVV